MSKTTTHNQVLQRSVLTPTHSVDLMGEIVKVGCAQRMLFEIKDHVEGLLVDLGGLKGLHMGVVSSCLVVAMIFLWGPSRPDQIGLDSVDILFPITTLALELRHAQS